MTCFLETSVSDKNESGGLAWRDASMKLKRCNLESAELQDYSSGESTPRQGGVVIVPELGRLFGFPCFSFMVIQGGITFTRLSS